MAGVARISATELYRNTGQVQRRVVVNKERLIVERNGYPIAALLPYAEYEALKRERARLELERYVTEQKALSRKVAAAQASEDEVMSDALKVVAETRRGKRKRR